VRVGRSRRASRRRLLAASEVVRAAGIDPVISRAGSEVLRGLAELELRDTFDHERPSDAEQVLAVIDEALSRQGLGEA